jgi:hypothetical protein
MEDAHYYRERAQTALELARQISDAKASAGLRELAARYQAQAEQAEQNPQSNPGDPN